MRKLTLGDAVTVVAHGDVNKAAVVIELYIHLAALAAVLHGVVKQIEKHLLEPLRVAGNERYLNGGLGIIDLNAGLTHKLAIGEERVLKLGGDVDKLDAEVEAPVLDPCEF